MNSRRKIEAGLIIATSTFVTIGSTYGLSKDVFAKEQTRITTINAVPEITLSNGQKIQIQFNTPTPTDNRTNIAFNHVTPTPEPVPNTEIVHLIASEESVKAKKTPTPTKIPTPASKPIRPLFNFEPRKDPEIKGCKLTDLTKVGQASYYTRDGCLGCSASLKTALGEDLDDNKLTAAIHSDMPIGRHYLVQNLITGESAVVWGNDRGGFDGYPWYRVADLSAASKRAIGGDDLTRVRITLCAS